MFDASKKALRDSGVEAELEALEKDEFEILARLTAIRQLAVEIDDYPVDYRGKSKKIVALVDELVEKKK